MSVSLYSNAGACHHHYFFADERKNVKNKDIKKVVPFSIPKNSVLCKNGLGYWMAFLHVLLRLFCSISFDFWSWERTQQLS